MLPRLHLGVAAVDDVVELRHGDFRAVIRLDRLCDLRRPSFRKLLRLCQWESRDALDHLGQYLTAQVECADINWAKAEQDFRSGWKPVTDKRSRKKEDRETLKENRRLKVNLTHAKRAYDTMVHLQQIFKEEINEYGDYLV